eukprot:TRINITY_DN59_c0_g1_i27.p1 TRINITY_DN59_c0_g1~~TRINITY_DN59_c0_g1_i27.p1  ORF type:complete len:344 (-),score=62.28 TRINITY_DN59_c0_g1_i27:178-1209(-)
MRCAVFALVVAVASANNQHYYDLNSVAAVPVATQPITVTNLNNVRTNMFCSSIDSSVIAANPTLRYMCNQRNSAFIGGAAQVDRTPRNLAGAAALNTALGLNLATGLAGNAGAGLNQGITVTNMNNVATNMFCSRISAAELAVNPTLAAMCNQFRSVAIAGAIQRDSRSSTYPEYPQYPVEQVYPTAPAYPEVHPVPALYPVPVAYPVTTAAASAPISVTNMNNVATNMFCSSMSVEQLTANPTLASMCNQAFSAAIAGAGQVVDDRAPRSSDPHHYYPAPVHAVQPVVPAVSPPITVTNMNNVFTNMYCSSLSVEQLTLNPSLASMCNQVRSAAISGAVQLN